MDLILVSQWNVRHSRLLILLSCKYRLSRLFSQENAYCWIVKLSLFCHCKSNQVRFFKLEKVFFSNVDNSFRLKSKYFRLVKDLNLIVEILFELKLSFSRRLHFRVLLSIELIWLLLKSISCKLFVFSLFKKSVDCILLLDRSSVLNLGSHLIWLIAVMFPLL